MSKAGWLLLNRWVCLFLVSGTNSFPQYPVLVGRAGWPLRRLRVFFVWRLYAAALVGQYEPLIRQDYAAMLRRWAEVYCLEGLWKE